MAEEIVNLYDCDSCGFRYDPKKFAGLDLDAQPDSFECPSCHAGRDHFQLFAPPSDDVAPPLDGAEDEQKLDPFGPRVMFTESSTPSVNDLQRRWQKKRLDTQPDFQRYEVWSPQKKSALIESILLDLPIPQIFLAEQPDESVIVVDGQQRLTSLFKYMQGEFALKKVSPKVEGKRFSELPGKFQEKIENYTMHVVTIRKESDEDVRFKLFQRLNEGSVSLNDQELRNCVWRGPYNELLKTLAEEAGWRKLMNLKKRHPRMVDVELVLRYMAFRDLNYMAHPDKKTGEFLDMQMSRGASYGEKENRAATKDFKTAVDLSLNVLGEHASRRFVAGTSEHHEGRWDSKINRALMDVQLWGFNRYSKGIFMKKADSVREAAIELMSTPEFSDLISHTISERKRVERRFDLWKQMLDSVLGDESQGPRLYSRKAKQAAFEADPTCGLCGQQIHFIDDAHMDHNEPYSKGGATTVDNGVLAHRYCNLSKSNS